MSGCEPVWTGQPAKPCQAGRWSALVNQLPAVSKHSFICFFQQGKYEYYAQTVLVSHVWMQIGEAKHIYSLLVSCCFQNWGCRHCQEAEFLSSAMIRHLPCLFQLVIVWCSSFWSRENCSFQSLTCSVCGSGIVFPITAVSITFLVSCIALTLTLFALTTIQQCLFETSVPN